MGLCEVLDYVKAGMAERVLSAQMLMAAILDPDSVRHFIADSDEPTDEERYSDEFLEDLHANRAALQQAIKDRTWQSQQPNDS